MYIDLTSSKNFDVDHAMEVYPPPSLRLKRTPLVDEISEEEHHPTNNNDPKHERVMMNLEERIWDKNLTLWKPLTLRCVAPMSPHLRS